MQKLEIEDRKDLVEHIKQIPVQNIISMEVETDSGSYLEGISWDFLKYVYNREKITKNESCQPMVARLQCYICGQMQENKT